jgi:ribosomal protein S18 acetylase RimI-like enzyme
MGPGSSVVIREATPADFGVIGELTVAAYAPVHPAEHDTDYLDEMRDVAAWTRVGTVYVAEDRSTGEITGAVRYVPGPEAGPPFAERERDGEAGFRMLAVAPEAQGRGIGRALVEACIARARADDRHGLVLLTLPSMVAARALYEKLGFRRAPERDWSVSEAIDLKAWTLELD